MTDQKEDRYSYPLFDRVTSQKEDRYSYPLFDWVTSQKEMEMVLGHTNWFLQM